MSSQGRNVWYDLMTTDLDGAKRFYEAAIGWKTEPWRDADPQKPYTMWLAGEQPIGGLMKLPPDAVSMGAPPHWLAYTTVEDVDASAEKARSLGGKVYAPPFDIPKVGRVSVLADPQGAVFAIFKPEAGDMPVAPPHQAGQISWAELNTTDYEAAWKFYSALFAWKHRDSMDMGGGEIYFMFTSGDETTRGGMSNVARQMGMPPHWLHYVTVPNIDAAIERIRAAGGKVLNGPMEVPGNDMIAQCQDPQGAVFAVYAAGKR